MMNLEIEKVAYHRNGISGEGFHVVLFIDHIEEGADVRMLGVVFTAPHHVAVFDRDLLGKGTIGMFEGPGNAWRGDDYEPYLRNAIDVARKAKGVI